MTHMKNIVLIFVLLLTFESFAKSGKVYISVGSAKAKKSLIAIPSLKFLGGNKNSRSARVGTEIHQTLKNDLETSGVFTLIKPGAFLENPSRIGLKPYPTAKNGFKYKNWSAIGAEFLVRAGYNVVGNDVTVEAYLYYIPQAKMIFGRQFRTDRKGVRKLAHMIGNGIIKDLTGKKAFFNSKIVVTANRDGNYKEIYTMDWDGYNIQRMTKHKNVSISPTWSADNKKIGYTSFMYHPKAKSRNPDLLIMKALPGAKPRLLSYRKGVNSGANFHPNGKDMFLTISKSGNADIYKMDISSGAIKPITKGPHGAMNVEPAISPDGRKLAFSSDRLRKPMIFIKDLATKATTRITHAGEYNATPVWSPDGKKIAFAAQDKGHFDIFIMDSDGMKIARLTSAKKKNGKWADNESPTFSPDGRFVMFTSNRTGTNQLYIIDTDAENERQITKDRFNYERPKWSGHLD